MLSGGSPGRSGRRCGDTPSSCKMARVFNPCSSFQIPKHGLKTRATIPLLQSDAMSQVTSAPATAFPCPRCRTWLHNGTLMCPSCGGLVYAHQLNQLSAEAQRQEPVNPMAAAQLWQQALPM